MNRLNSDYPGIVPFLSVCLTAATFYAGMVSDRNNAVELGFTLSSLFLIRGYVDLLHLRN